MSELDDDTEILEDIKALEHVLAQQRDSEVPEDDEENRETERGTKQRPGVAATQKNSNGLIQEAYEINQALILKYRAAKEAVEKKLKECLKKQEEVDLKLKLVAKGSKPNCHIRYSKAGSPYFKDEKLFKATKNEDALMKKKRGELMIVYQRSPSRWTVKDRNCLWMAVRLQAATEYFDKETRKQKQAEGRGSEDDVEIDVDKCQLPKNYKEMIGRLGSREFDWMKIAVQSFGNRHSAEECRVMWNVYLHPDINRYKFSKAEDAQLKSAVEMHDYQDWDAIAKTMNTGRSGYQYFIRYTTIYGPIQLKHSEAVWSAKDNNTLIATVRALKVGNFVPWSEVTSYIENRTKNQVYSHWKYNIDPSLRKGRFTADEDELILEGVEKYGKDFSKISAELIPHRTSVQLSGRFTLLMLKTDQSYNSWTVAEDMQLLKLYDKFGPKWSKIAGIMKKNRTYLRHRYQSIGKHLAKGRDLSTLSRKRKRSHAEDGEEDQKLFEEGFVLTPVHDVSNADVDTKLKRYFERVQTPIARPGRKAKYLSDTELERHTKMLYNVLQKMDARLDIPDILDAAGLTAKDKQLLVSFRDYSRGRGKESGRDVEALRIKMFGPDRDNTPFYIPPAPFGLYFKQYGRKNKKGSEKTTSDDCSCAVDITFETPENINKMLTEKEQDMFEKLSLLISERCRGPYECQQKLFVMEMSPGAAVEASTDETTTISWGRKMGREVNRDIHRDMTTFVEPCHSSLIGYDTLNYMKKSNSSLDWTKEEKRLTKRPVSNAGKHAFYLFKARFTRLFKYPIVMVRQAEAQAARSSTEVVPRAAMDHSNRDDENVDDMDR